MNYEVKITQTERGGKVFYVENDLELSFDWELAIDGALVFVSSAPHWNNFCERNAFPPAQDRRDEILQKLCAEIIRQKTSGGEFAVGDDFISISFG